MNLPIAKVVVSSATYHIDKLYDYLVPETLIPLAVAGMRVLVPFGIGSKKVEGVILSVATHSAYDKLKTIDSVMDDEPLFDEENIKLALWMRDRFFCTVYDALRCMHPSKLDFKQKIRGRKTDTSQPRGPTQTVLNSEQAAVFDEISPLLRSKSPKAALLYGVTGSGKTIVYIKLIETALELGKTAIVLVPEIALTPQTVRIFESHFGSSVAVLHSRLADGERYNEWKRIRDGDVNVVVGTRSAIFAPLKNIGLIVIDEEQEHTYKSENSPRYHARDIAKYRITRSSGLLLLASATPSIESMYAAKLGKYTLLRLNTRFNEKDMPSVIIADMRDELKTGNGGQISSVLRREIEINIQNGEQSILFLNRRGANTMVACGECGYTYTCCNCSVSMTYHSAGNRLLCHYCGHSLPSPAICPECSGKLKFIGAGTQKVEQELLEIFPGINIIRMDADTTTRKNSHDTMLSRFRDTKAEILLGTQMVTKGLDFENVTLVGVLGADLSLYISDFRAGETTFSLITQVVGRSGRGEKTGRAVIQTFTPKNKVILQASKQDFDSFYESEIMLRETLELPPVRDLISLTATGIKENAVISACDLLKIMLQHYFSEYSDIKLLGPAPAPVSKINKRYVYRLMLSCENNKHVRETLSHIMREFAKDKRSRGVMVFANVE